MTTRRLAAILAAWIRTQSSGNLIGPERAIGCVINPACEVIRPRVIEHHEFKRFTLGEPDGSGRNESVALGEPDGSGRNESVALGEAMNMAGFDAPIREKIRWNAGSSCGATFASTRSVR